MVAGFAAVSLKWTVHYAHHVLGWSFRTTTMDYWFYFLPMIGIFITFLIAKYLFKENLGHGISSVIHSIAQKSSYLRKRMMMSRMFTSLFTVGFGGSVGLEAPIAVTGSAIGSNIGRFWHMHYKTRTLLIACGSAAAVSAIFSAPIGGVIFAIEIILIEFSVAMFIPLLIASVSGYVTSLILLGEDILFAFKLTEKFNPYEIHYFILLGVACGLIAVLFTRSTYFVEGLIKSVKNPFIRILIGGLILGGIILCFPPIYGEGYESIKFLFNNHAVETQFGSAIFKEGSEGLYMIIFLVGTILVKCIATPITIGSGGSGGIFAPSLFLGGFTGFLFAYTANLFLDTPISVGNFTIVGMCGVMSGVLHAPLTAIFLIAEVTDGYTLFVPLMLVAAISFSTISYFEPFSIYKKHLIQNGELHTTKDSQVLQLLNVRKLIERDFKTVHPDATLGELVQIIKSSPRNIFPVVNTECELVGIVTLDDVRSIMFDVEKYGVRLVKTFMTEPKTVISKDADIQEIIDKFEHTGYWNLPVTNKDGIYIGFYSKSKIYSAYRERLKRQNRED